MYEVFINFYIFLSETVMIVFIHWQVGGVMNRLNSVMNRLNSVMNRLNSDPLISLSSVLSIILITLFWVMNSCFPSVVST